MRKISTKHLLTLLMLLAAYIGIFTSCQEKQDPKQYAEKPVIYLYPETPTDITVKLNYIGTLTCTYPAYHDGCQVQ